MALYAIVLGAAALAIAGTYLILRPPARCQNCGAELPKPGLPGTASYAASGRIVCQSCGKTVDSSGRVISD